MSAVRPLSFELAITAHNAKVAFGSRGWPISKKVRAAIYSRDNHRCYYCASTFDLTIDHKVPQVIGGSSHASNLVTACKPCNSAKCAKPVSLFLENRFGEGAA